MGKRTRDEFRKGSGTRGPIVRERKPWAGPEGAPGQNKEAGEPAEGHAFGLEDKAEEALTDLGEQEAAAESENETADLDSVEEAPAAPVDPRFPEEAAPLSHSGGSID